MIKLQQQVEREAELLRLVRTGAGRLSRVELARALGMSPSTAGSYVERLLAAGYLLEGGKQEPGDRGRPGTRLHLNPAAGFMLGLDFTHHYLRVVSLDFTEQVWRRQRLWIETETPFELVLGQAEQMASAGLEGGRGPLLAVGLSLPPFFRAGNLPQYLRQWRREQVNTTLEAVCRRRPAVTTSVVALAAAELWFGAGRNVDTFVALEARAAVGAGLILGGRLVTPTPPGGQIGHWECPAAIIPPRLRDAGISRGTLDELASVPGLLGHYRQLLNGHAAAGDIPFNQLQAACRDRDPLALVSLSAAANALGWGIARLTDLITPELVIVSYPLATFGESFFASMEAAVRAAATPDAPAPPRIVGSGLDEYAGAIGAAAVALQHWRPGD